MGEKINPRCRISCSACNRDHSAKVTQTGCVLAVLADPHGYAGNDAQLCECLEILQRIDRLLTQNGFLYGASNFENNLPRCQEGDKTTTLLTVNFEIGIHRKERRLRRKFYQAHQACICKDMGTSIHVD
jgi:hypothetical protein